MKKIALVTDSTADLTETMRVELNAHIMPLKITFGNQEYSDGELSPHQFYHRLQTATELPRSSQPSPEDFKQLYQRLMQKHDSVLSIHLSSALSGTVNAARVAAESLAGKIHVVDSKTISLGIGLIVSEASRCIKAGMNIAPILERLRTVRTGIETIFTLDTLDYLQKGGRIGKAACLLGTLINIKPVIRVNEDGIYVPVSKARSGEKALCQIVKGFKQLAGGRKIKKLAVAHGAAPEAAGRLKQALEAAFEIPVTIFTEVGAVIGVHTGPGTVGAAIQFET